MLRPVAISVNRVFLSGMEFNRLEVNYRAISGLLPLHGVGSCGKITQFLPGKVPAKQSQAAVGCRLDTRRIVVFCGCQKAVCDVFRRLHHVIGVEHAAEQDRLGRARPERRWVELGSLELERQLIDLRRRLGCAGVLL